MNSIKFIARFAATAALIAGVSSQVAAQGTCPVNAQCTEAGWFRAAPVGDMDPYGPAPAPFSGITLSVDQFDPADYVGLHSGVSVNDIHLVAVELRLSNTVNSARYWLKNNHPTNSCTGTWGFDINAELGANASVGSPALTATVPLGGSIGILDPGEEYEYNLPAPVTKSECISWRVQDGNPLFANWIGTGTVDFQGEAAAPDTSQTDCGVGATSWENMITMKVEVTYIYCYPPTPPLDGECLCETPSDHYRVPGSLLLFPEFDNTAGDVTILSVTNVDCLDSAGEDVELHFVYIDADGCDEFNKNETLSPCDTFTTLTNFHSPGQDRGYVYVYAQDPVTHEPIVWNHLIGNLMVISGLQQFNYGINPVAFRGLAGSGADGTPTDVDNDGERDLNNVEYAGAPDVITIPRFLGQDGGAAAGMVNSEMILVALSGGKQFETDVCFFYYNDNEEEFSGEYSFTCWAKPTLLELSGGFAEDWLQAQLSDDPDEILGIQAPGHRNAGWICLWGCFATSTRETIENPSIYAVLVEHVGNYGVADLPFECGVRINGSLLPNNVYGDGDGPGNPAVDGDNK